MNETMRIIKPVGLLFCSVLIMVLTGYATNDDRSRMTGAINQQNRSNTLILATVDQYYPTGTGHWIDLVMDHGAKLKLEDKSVWEIADKDQFQTQDWRVAQKISVSQNPNARYPFKLTNTDQKSAADARLEFQPKYNEELTQ